jgi:hypothetical protein
MILHCPLGFVWMPMKKLDICLAIAQSKDAMDQGPQMDKGVVKVAIERVFESVGVLLIVLGAAMFVLGAAGGINYNNWLPVDTAGRIALVGSGIPTLVVGVILALRSNDPRAPLGIKITFPVKGQSVGKIDVQGTIAKKLPKDQELWIIRMYPQGDFIPLRRVNLKPGDKDWIAKDCDVGGKSGEDRTLCAFLVGPSAKEYFKYFREAASRHNAWMDKLQVPKDEPDRYLPNIKEPTGDMIECHRVDVKRA